MRNYIEAELIHPIEMSQEFCEGMDIKLTAHKSFSGDCIISLIGSSKKLNINCLELVKFDFSTFKSAISLVEDMDNVHIDTLKLTNCKLPPALINVINKLESQ